MVSQLVLNECEREFRDPNQLADCKRVFEILESRLVRSDAIEQITPQLTTKALRRRVQAAIQSEYDENPISTLNGKSWDTRINFSQYADPYDFFVPTEALEPLLKHVYPYYGEGGEPKNYVNLLEEILDLKPNTLFNFGGCNINDNIMDCGALRSEKAQAPNYNRNYVILHERKVDENGDVGKKDVRVKLSRITEKMEKWLEKAEKEINEKIEADDIYEGPIPFVKAKKVELIGSGDYVVLGLFYKDAQGADKYASIQVDAEERSKLERMIVMRNAYREYYGAITSMAPLGEQPVRVTISNEPWDQLTKSGKCFGRGWDSCEMPTGAYAQGVFDDVEHWNGVAIFRWGSDLNKKAWDGRVQLRWCRKPGAEDGDPKIKDIGIEERLYPQGGGRPGVDSLRPHPYEMALVPWLKNVLKGEGYLDYNLCVTPYKHKGGYDDMMHGWIAGHGFDHNHSLYDAANINPSFKPTELYFGPDWETRKEAFLEIYEPEPEPEPEPEEEQADEDVFDLDSWLYDFSHQHNYEGVLRDENASDYQYIYRAGNLRRIINDEDWSSFNEDGYSYPDFSDGWGYMGVSEVSSDDDDYLDWATYPSKLQTLGDTMENVGIEAFVVVRPATSQDNTPITDYYSVKPFKEAADYEEPEVGFKNMSYSDMGSALGEFESCVYEGGSTARQRRRSERREAGAKKATALNCATKLFKELNVAKSSHPIERMLELGLVSPSATDVRVEAFTNEWIENNEALIEVPKAKWEKYLDEVTGMKPTPDYKPGPLFSLCAYLQQKHPVSSDFSVFDSKKMAKDVANRVFPDSIDVDLLQDKCRKVTPELIQKVKVKGRSDDPNSPRTIHAYSPWRQSVERG
jgi:hypothetical protein